MSGPLAICFGLKEWEMDGYQSEQIVERAYTRTVRTFLNEVAGKQWLAEIKQSKNR